MTPEQRALHACTDYARLSAEIKRLTRAIGEALDHCPGIEGKRLPAGWTIATPEQSRAHDDDLTHLKEAYTPDCDDSDHGYYEPVARFMTDPEVREYLSVCPHCLAAHEAIQARKAARKSLGAAKRAITMIGRRANQQSTTAQDSHA
jgi:hypothetical protein